MTPVESDEQDLTRKQRREQARQQRKALEEQAAASAARRTRMMQLGIAVAIVVVAIVGILIATGSSGKHKAVAPSSPEASKNAAAVSGLLGGIQQSGNSIGPSSAPVTLQYFGDLQCPVCREFSTGALEPLIEKWVRPGKLRIEYRSMETATREPEIFKTQQVAALAAGKQSKLWDYIELFYKQQGEENSGYVTEAFLQGLAQQVPGLDLTRWTTDRNNPALVNEVAADEQASHAAGFSGTPSFLIGKTGGSMKRLEYSSLTDPSSFNEAIEQQLKA